MTVKELKEALKYAKDDEVLGIVVKPEHAYVGGTYAVGVKWAGSGFDWNHGRFMIRPEVDLWDADGVKILVKMNENQKASSFAYRFAGSKEDYEKYLKPNAFKRKSTINCYGNVDYEEVKGKIFFRFKDNWDWFVTEPYTSLEEFNRSVCSKDVICMTYGEMSYLPKGIFEKI